MAFLAANVVKIPQGGWFTIVVAVLIFTVMTTWKRGRRLVAARLGQESSLADVLNNLQAERLVRVPGTAVFLSGNPQGAPSALLANITYNGVMHEHIVLLTVKTKQVPHVEANERVEVELLGHGIYRMTIWYGFMEEPTIPKVLETAKLPGLEFDPQQITYFVNRSSVIASKIPGMALWREKFFAFMSHNAASAVDYYCLPPTRVVEIGTRVEF